MPLNLDDTAGTTLAHVLRDLGDISPIRIGLPVGSATEEDLIHHLHCADKRLFELIDGVLLEKVYSMPDSLVNAIIGTELLRFLDNDNLGFAFAANGPFRVKPGRIRMPDTGFVSWDRISDEALLEEPILGVAPNLAVEVISEGNTPGEMEQKLQDYFKAGVQLVWYIYPKTQTAVVYTSPTAKKTIDKNGSLDGGKVLPGFSLPLKKLFGRTKRRPNGK